MSLEVELVPAIEDEWLALAPIRLGRVPPTQGTPDWFVKVAKNGRPTLRLDVYVNRSEEAFVSQRAIAWRGWVALGLGHHVHLVRAEDPTVVSLALDEYFSDFAVAEDALLVLSASRITRVSDRGEVIWRSEPVAVDGVVIEAIDANAIVGRGEFDPPGVWRSFRLAWQTGRPAA